MLLLKKLLENKTELTHYILIADLSSFYLNKLKQEINFITVEDVYNILKFKKS